MGASQKPPADGEDGPALLPDRQPCLTLRRSNLSISSSSHLLLRRLISFKTFFPTSATAPQARECEQAKPLLLPQPEGQSGACRHLHPKSFRDRKVRPEGYDLPLQMTVPRPRTHETGALNLYLDKWELQKLAANQPHRRWLLPSQLPHRDLQIRPGFFLLARIAQQVRRVVRHDQFGPERCMHPSAQ
jgi:hypothetical protein